MPARAQVRIDQATYLSGKFLIARLIQHMGVVEAEKLLIVLRDEASGNNPGSGAAQAMWATAMLEGEISRLEQNERRLKTLKERTGK